MHKSSIAIFGNTYHRLLNATKLFLYAVEIISLLLTLLLATCAHPTRFTLCPRVVGALLPFTLQTFVIALHVTAPFDQGTFLRPLANRRYSVEVPLVPLPSSAPLFLDLVPWCPGATTSAGTLSTLYNHNICSRRALL